MISKKICMMGAFSVGKTSLVSQYVHSMFSDRYLSTVGVKISKKEMELGGTPVNLVLWDMEGRDNYADVNVSYLRGATGFFVVADGTRQETLDGALSIRRLALDVLGDIPHYLLLNKADLAEAWEISGEMLARAEKDGLKTIMTSAKTGQAVGTAFESLARDMLREDSGEDA